MNPAYRWIAASVLLVLAALSASKGMDLRALGTDVDGAGIGVYFLSFEINDRVAEMSIPAYAIGFFIASGVLALGAIGLILTAVLRKKVRNDLKNA
ncbi:hypothetical protein ACTL32_01445 [Planococcus sp. FY231025]|uniref:hypothetical protein n=1 Tax=Planococcus sp. FY231025 TaxID=3455699 RepID=UPI003F914B0A